VKKAIKKPFLIGELGVYGMFGKAASRRNVGRNKDDN
jgi:hypothetical protein